MLYRYETHCHCSQCSACSVSRSEDLVRAYKAAGYTGLVLTDHFIHGNTAVDRNLPWKSRMRYYFEAYLQAKIAAEPLDFDVIFGIEHAYGDGKEVLIYGIGLPFLLENPDIPDLSLDELTVRVHKAGGIVIQAHPYRNRPYVNMAVGPRSDLADGIEVYNIGNKPGEDRQALTLAKSGAFIQTSGGDIHYAGDDRIGMAGIALPYRIRNEKELVAALKRGDHHYIIDGKIVPEIKEEMLP
jgi:predicted metal-dependent phosphoesterase TrpH